MSNIVNECNREDLDKILDFLKKIDLDYQVENGIQGTFSKHMDIKNGILCFDYEKASIANILHEAGHLALVLKKYRYLFNGNLHKGFKDYTAIISELPYGEERTDILSCYNDPEVTAWAWAVGVELNLNPEQVIEDGDYEGDGGGVRLTLEVSDKSHMPYRGVVLLHYGKFTNKFNRIEKEKKPEKGFYPIMNYWTADEALEKRNLQPI